jgi:cytochrome c553
VTTFVRVIAALGLVFVAWLLGGSKSREHVVQAPFVRIAVKHPWLTTGAMAIGVLAVAVVLVMSGVVPLNASSGHWRITTAILDFAKVRSVSTHSWGTQAPPLGDESLVLRGAGHYETACLPCHGGPGRRLPPVMAGMTPPPPDLSSHIPRWTPAQLFTIVKHGIKFTGMPAWPAQQRDDEVWAMVAFLKRLPQLDAAGYRYLTIGNTAELPDWSSNAPGTATRSPAIVRATCQRCHGLDGTGRGPGAFPSLAGQSAEYLYVSLRAFADRSRFSGVMSSIAASLSDDGMHAAASYYAGLPPREVHRVDPASTLGPGAAIAARGIPDRDIPACIECHGPAGRPKNPAYPRLAAQHAGYLEQQLGLLRERRRGGSENVNLMHVFVDRLRADEIQDVSRYYGAAAPALSTTSGPP